MINKPSFFKTIQRLTIISLVVLVAVPMSAQFGLTENYHFGYISGTVGYSMLQTNLSGALPQGKLGGAVGAGYEFRHTGFWASVGVQLSFHRSSLLVDEYNTRKEPDQNPYRGFDTQGHKTTFHYRVNQVDEMAWNFIDVPVMLGYYVKGFHIGGGIKVSYALDPQTHTVGTYNLSATNDELDVTFENMPDRGYTDYRYDAYHKNRLNVGVSLVGEIGYDLLSQVQTRSALCNIMILSFYFEYGLNNYLSTWDAAESRVVPDRTNMLDATVYPYLNTFTNPARTVPFYTGVKLTYMIGGNPNDRGSRSHKGCMCYQ